MDSLIMSTSIFEISSDPAMINIAVDSFSGLDNSNNFNYVYDLLPAFFYLAKFQVEETRGLIKKYLNHPEYLIAFNAERALKLA